jgi:ATP/ADP translocase
VDTGFLYAECISRPHSNPSGNKVSLPCHEILLTFLFWYLANHIFSARQSKRLFPLMVSGGILGGLCGSFSTLWFVHLGAVDNVLWAYVAGTMAAAFLAGRLASAEGLQAVKALVNSINLDPQRNTTLAQLPSQLCY